MNRVMIGLLQGAILMLSGCHALMTVNGVQSDLPTLESVSWGGRYVARIDRHDYMMDVLVDASKQCCLVDAGTNGCFKAAISKWDAGKFWISLTISDESGRRILRGGVGFEPYFLIPVHCNLVLEEAGSGFTIWLVSICDEISNGRIVSDLPIDTIMRKCKDVRMRKIGELKRATD